MNSKKSVFMCVNYPKYNESMGISQKIDTQIKTFEKMGYSVTWSAYDNNGIVINNGGKTLVNKKYPVYLPQKLVGALKRFYLMKTCDEYLVGKKFTLGYIRWTAIDSMFLKVIKKLRNNCEYVVIDCHGYFPNMRGIGIKGTYTVFFTRLNKRKVERYADIALTETKAQTVFGIKSITMDTGIDVERYEKHRYNGPENELHLISVSNETVYHGLDRIINGMGNYYAKNPELKVYLHLVGNITESTKNLIRIRKLNDYVILYGYQSGDALQRIYNSANMGVGPLSPSRVGGKEGTGIKTKEYFAIGLPYFYGGTELLIDASYPYIHNVPDNEQPIDINDLFNFYDACKQDTSLADNMREYARKHFNWEIIYKNMFKELGLEV